MSAPMEICTHAHTRTHQGLSPALQFFLIGPHSVADVPVRITSPSHPIICLPLALRSPTGGNILRLDPTLIYCNESKRNIVSLHWTYFSHIVLQEGLVSVPVFSPYRLPSRPSILVFPGCVCVCVVVFDSTVELQNEDVPDKPQTAKDIIVSCSCII